MSLDGEEEMASATTTGLISDDHLEASQDKQRADDESSLQLSFSIENGEKAPSPPSPASSASSLESSPNNVRRIPYLPSCDFVLKCRGSIRLAFLSHACFLTASLFYLKLSLADLAWVQTARRYNVPGEILDEDDDEVWEDWADANPKNGSAVEDLRDEYDAQSRLLYVLGAAFFAFVGVLDWMRYGDGLNVVMIAAGAAGVVSGLSDTSFREALWDAISVHLYLLEGCNLLRREHDYENEFLKCFRLGDVCFLVGSILDVIGSYFELAGFEMLLW
eukprot:CAMPEP_0172533968 /NCGR_PEP_ID=MMETSP1067-20121228/6502_1 /TAXON_ID=265564 ORGANISM="Thalassiosira punctigera, Strain Tpunct2005C2" /NCGR_SAMPLE_ID=MMETSP1067 /ASSEMBLY_ACC=CAM_ASM_000444 /LENGTH=275 /DNA_ID=CAMNT_0013318693 /DNA_START=104 /DNA_END=928 /DNA_ORIENTATION=-